MGGGVCAKICISMEGRKDMDPGGWGSCGLRDGSLTERDRWRQAQAEAATRSTSTVPRTLGAQPGQQGVLYVDLFELFARVLGEEGKRETQHFSHRMAFQKVRQVTGLCGLDPGICPQGEVKLHLAQSAGNGLCVDEGVQP